MPRRNVAAPNRLPGAPFTQAPGEVHSEDIDLVVWLDSRLPPQALCAHCQKLPFQKPATPINRNRAGYLGKLSTALLETPARVVSKVLSIEPACHRFMR